MAQEAELGGRVLLNDLPKVERLKRVNDARKILDEVFKRWDHLQTGKWTSPRETEMSLEIHPDVQTVAEFMQGNLPACRLVSISEALAALAPILWGRHGRESVNVLALHTTSNSVHAAHTPPAAT